MNATWKVRWNSLSLVLLFFFVILHMTVLFVVIKYLLPTIWLAQLTAGWPLIMLVFFGRSISNCFLEWFVHRYMLHTWIVSWLKRFWCNHGKHHGLTAIGIKKHESLGEIRVFSRYFLDEEGDWFNVSLADYTLLAFIAVETAFALPLQLVFPEIPFLISGYLAVACSYALYEIIHPLEHRPKEWWDAKFSNPFWSFLRWYVSRLRRRHQYHHLHPRFNMAIMGLFGYPLADKFFRTDLLPPDILYDGALVNEKDLVPPSPHRFVLWLDAWARKREVRFCVERGD